MKLHLVLDYTKGIHCREDDIVVVSARNTINFCCKQLTVDESVINESKDIFVDVNKWFNHIPDDYDCIKNETYIRFFRPILAVISFLNEVLKEYQIESILLYGGSGIPFYMSENAEGEGEKKLYKTNWLVNAYVESYYKDKMRIQWTRKQPKILFLFYYYFRNKYENLVLLFREIRRSFATHNNNNIILFREQSNRFLLISDLLLQYEHLNGIAKIVEKSSYDVKFYNFTFGKNIAARNPDSTYVGGIKFKDVLCVAFNRLPSINPSLSIKGVSVLSSYLLERECKYLYRQLKFREKRLENTIVQSGDYHGCKVLTDMTARHIIAIRNVCRKLGIVHYNIQHVTMSRILYPELNLSDVFYLYAKKTFDLYSEFSNSYRLYFPVNYKDINNPCRSSLVFSVFCQPDRYTQSFIEYVHSVLDLIMLRNIKCEVIVKPHYRQNRINDFKEIVSKYGFAKMAGKEAKCSDIIKKSDICMSISSSVIFEAMTFCKPCIIFNPNHIYDDEIYNADICYPDVNFVTDCVEETIKILDAFPSYRNLYDKRLMHFLYANKCESDWLSMLDIK